MKAWRKLDEIYRYYARSRKVLIGLSAAVLTLMFCAAPRADTKDHQPCVASIRALYERASPAVVRITGQSVNPYNLANRVSTRLGSGFLFDPAGMILTNAHVVYGLQTLLVTLDDGATQRAKVIGADPIFDLAVIQLEAPKKGKLPTISLGDSDQLRPGDEVVAIGNPLGLDQTVTHGIVSGLNRSLREMPLYLAESMIQTDAAINPGNSGGPLLNACGEAVGVNTSIMGGAQNIGFAIPIKLAKAAIPALIKDGRIIRPWIGFHGQWVDAEARALLRVPMVDGLLVEAVETGSPAEAVGLRGGELELTIGQTSMLFGGDIIVGINGNALRSSDQTLNILRGLKVGERIRLRLFHNGQHREVSYMLPERPVLPGDIETDAGGSAVAPVQTGRRFAIKRRGG